MQWNLHSALVQRDALVTVVQWHCMGWVVSCAAPAVYIRFACAALLCVAALQHCNADLEVWCRCAAGSPAATPYTLDRVYVS